jgi:hypothetical protein
MHGFGEIFYAEGTRRREKGSDNGDHHISYRGFLYNDFKHGYGEEITTDMSYYGDFIHGQKQGRAKIVWNRMSSKFYEGEVLEGLPHGRGKMNFGDGVYLNGSWNQGDMEGTGEGTTQEGFKWHGGVKANILTGDITVEYTGKNFLGKIFRWVKVCWLVR